MKRSIYIVFMLLVLLFSCQSNQSADVLPVTEDVVLPETVKDVVLELEDEPVVQTLPPTKEFLEYERSIYSTTENISLETFAEDKADILLIIEQLSAIMKTKDYNSWLKYLTQDSIDYWSNQKNLIAVSARLPIKNYRLKNLQDYFEKVFIPSRHGRIVDEIRYTSKTRIKAVQYTESHDIIYYYFQKIGDSWLLQLDTNS